MKRNVPRNLLLLSFILLLTFTVTPIFSGCAAKKNMLAEADLVKALSQKAREKQKEVHELGGPVCGMKELAIAESHRVFALYEIEEGHYPTVREHLDIGKSSADLAYEKAVACEPPDRDHDRILDNVDECPDDPEDHDGFQDEDGCPDPDNDQDGLMDDDDKCPDDPEDMDDYKDEDGCPDPDNDSDGIIDVDDQCPVDAEDKDEWEDEDGCPDPDNDQDGILDEEDKCPNEAETFNGTDDEDGCPDEDKYDLINVTDKQIELKQKVYFASGRDTILKRSYPLLNEVALALKDLPNLRVSIDGHTDSNGSDDYNMKLSQRRADSVRKYLIEKGGIAPERLSAKGYGETKPIATNRTSSGREKNRRVEFNIVK